MLRKVACSVVEVVLESCYCVGVRVMKVHADSKYICVYFPVHLCEEESNATTLAAWTNQVGDLVINDGQPSDSYAL